MFEKSYKHQLDAKNRMRMPPKLKELLQEGYSITISSSNCLRALSKEETENLYKRLESVDEFDEAAQNAVRAMSGLTYTVEEDAQGRFILPEQLRQYAGIKKNIVIIKTPRCIEIWAEEKWEETVASVNFSELFKALSQNK